MNRFLAMLARRVRATVAASHFDKRRYLQPGQQFAHQRGLRLEPLESRTLLSATWDEPKGSTIYVDDTAVGLNNGTSWADAYTSLQTALTAAVSGDEIHVAQGTFKPTTNTDRTKSFALKNGVSIRGGYAGDGAANPDARDVGGTPSILSGDIGVVGSTDDNSYHVVLGNGTGPTAILDGFTITLGNASASSTPNNIGGGMYNKSSSPTLTNCTFTVNSAFFDGGGMFNSTSSPTLTNCAFAANSAYHGGGMSNTYSSSPTLTNCTFTANSAVDGGAMDNDYNSPSSPRLTNCIVWVNSPAANQLSGDASVVTYCDIQGGYSGTGNTNADPQFVCVPNSGPDGTWATGDDSGDLSLRLNSPCIDAGNNAAVPSGVVTDLAGNLRRSDIPGIADTGSGTAPRVDLGAYEAAPKVQALAGGPYGVLEGKSIVLSGAGYSPQGLPVSYAWDLDADGLFDDAFEPSPVFSAAAMQTPQTLTISLRVTDTSDASITCSASVHVVRAMYVDDNAVGSNDGTSWANAYTNLQSALAAAAFGQVIRVAQGTYRPTAGTDRTASFRLGSSVSICGGYAGDGASDPDARDVSLYPSILSGDIGTIGDVSDNSYHVVVACGADCTSLLDGFTITAGSTTAIYPDDRGGGLFNSFASPRLTNCTFTANSAGYGGGMFNNCSPTLINCAFTANSASRGGGMSNVSSPTLTNCTFTANLASSGGGGMYNYSSSPALTDCTFTANTDYSRGGGMYNDSFSSPSLTNCTFTANTCMMYGGGSGMYNYSSCTPTLTNCILWGNSYFSQITGGTPVVTYCDIQGGYAGTKNLNADPQFVRSPATGPDRIWGSADDDYGDLRLRWSSPCIDAGNNVAVPVGVANDITGAARLADASWVVDTGDGTPPIVDLGAYERSGTNNAPTATVQITGTPAGTNHLFTATATKADADGDPVSLTFVWKVNGVEKQRTIAATALIDAFDLGLPGNGGKGDAISVEVVPNDGLMDGTLASDSVVVSDSLPTDVTLAPASVVEIQPAGTLVGVLSSSDLDENETFIYELVPGAGGGDNASFQLNGDKLRTTGPLDFGVKSSYSIRVRTTDASGLSLEKPLSVAVLPTLDVDRNAVVEPLTDGLLILRYLFDFRGQPLVKGLVDQKSARSTPAAVLQFLDACRTSLLDVDADGQAGGMTDGLLILRYLSDFRGPSLVNGVVGSAAVRSTPEDIAAFLQSQMPPTGKSGAKSAAAFAQQSADRWFGLLGDAGQEFHRSTLLRSRRVSRNRA